MHTIEIRLVEMACLASNADRFSVCPCEGTASLQYIPYRFRTFSGYFLARKGYRFSFWHGGLLWTPLLNG
eukprot:s272_g13.t1